MPLKIIIRDITEMEADAIVNAANTELKNYAPLQGGGVCGAIFRAAGQKKLQTACDELAPIETGQAVITPGFALPAKHIIHTAGPVWQGGNHGESNLLRSCYINSLNLAKAAGLKSIAFPLISSGIYGYPQGQALNIARDVICDWLEAHKMEVFLVFLTKGELSNAMHYWRAEERAFEIFGIIRTFEDELIAFKKEAELWKEITESGEHEKLFQHVRDENKPGKPRIKAVYGYDKWDDMYGEEYNYLIGVEKTPGCDTSGYTVIHIPKIKWGVLHYTEKDLNMTRIVERIWFPLEDERKV